jgi:hypothetical protein
MPCPSHTPWFDPSNKMWLELSWQQHIPRYAQAISHVNVELQIDISERLFPSSGVDGRVLCSHSIFIQRCHLPKPGSMGTESDSQWCSVPAETTWGAVGETSQSWESRISSNSDYTMGLGWKWILLDAEYSYLKLFTNNHSQPVFYSILAWILSIFLPQTLLLGCRLR